MSLNQLTHRAASILKEQLHETCPGQISSVRVFGSRARGDAREDSDLDILVLTRGDDSEVRRKASDAVYYVYQELDYPFPISAHVMTQDHFDELVRRERLFARSVLEEGVVL